MMNSNPMNENNYIDISDNKRPADDRPVDIPVITVESLPYSFDESHKEKRKNMIWPICIVFILLLFVAGLFIYLNGEPSLKSSVSDEQNIDLLSSTHPEVEGLKGVNIVTDSILGVAFNIYPLEGLRGHLEKEIPDTADQSVVLFMRSADYHPDGSTIGTVVMNGKHTPAKERRSRAAYMAFSKEGIPALGISLSDDLSDFAQKNEGDFFRQFPLLIDGELPSSFVLHGKVERGAIGRMADGSLNYFLTRNRESMYDFADALREYGVVDAIYITGGNGYEFYRDMEGNAHVSDNLRRHYDKYPDRKSIAPLLVWRTK